MVLALALAVRCIAADADPCAFQPDPDVPGPVVRVAPVLNVPTFVVDNKTFNVPAFETYAPEQKYFDQFSSTGVQLFSFNTNVTACDYGHSKPTWIDLNTWDYSGFEERVARVLKANPEAMILPRVNMGTPRWWLDANPGELEILDNGKTHYDANNRNPTLPKDRGFPSLVSKKWREDQGAALARFIQHVQQAPYAKHIFGYVLFGGDTEEWYHWSSGSDQLAGYSTHTLEAFRAWLRQRYETPERLQAAWNRPEVNFETATVPTREERYDLGKGTFRDPSRAMNVIDFYTFYNEMIPDTIDYFAAIAKRETKGRKAIGAFYAYMYEFRGDPEYGHNALGKFNRSKNIDFIFVTASYEDRAFATGSDYARSPLYSVLLHGKLWYHDNDVISFLAPDVMKRVGILSSDDWSVSMDHYKNVLGYTETAEHTRWMYRRSMGFALCTGSYESYFDLHGGYYDHPELLAEVKQLNRLATVAQRFERESNSEILVVADEVSNNYATFRSEMLAHTLLSSQTQFSKIGASADHVLLEDLPLLDTKRYKLVIFLNCYAMTNEQREVIETKLQGRNRTLLFAYAPGLFDGNTTDPRRMQALTGMRITAGDPDTLIAPAIELAKATYAPVTRYAAEHGQRLWVPFKSAHEDELTTGFCQLYRVEDPEAETLGVLPGTSHVVLARRNMGNWTSVYSITPTLPASFYRELAREAGVHIYNEHDDMFYQNTNFAVIHASSAGPRTINFPWKVNVYDMVNEKQLAPNTTKFEYNYQRGETLILRWRPWL